VTVPHVSALRTEISRQCKEIADSKVRTSHPSTLCETTSFKLPEVVLAQIREIIKKRRAQNE